MAKDTKNTLILVRRAPYGKNLGRDALEVALAYATFEQPIALLFIGEGVWQLLPHQHSESIHQKPLDKLLNVLPLYDINQVYVCSDSLQCRGIDADGLTISAEVLDVQALQTKLANAQHILSF